MTYTVLARSDDRDAWLAARQLGVGASDTPSLMGLTRYASAVSMWAEKTGRLIPDDAEFDNERMRWGVKLEPLVADEYERQTGRELQHWGALLSYDDLPFILATPDFQWHDSGVDIPVEIKTTDVSRASEWRDGPPERVYCQMQQQMLVTGAPMASTGVLVGGNTFRWADVERDEDYIQEIIRVTSEFWRYVADDVSPPMDGSEATTDAVAKMWPQSSGEAVVLTDDAYEWARDIDAAKEARKQADEQVKVLENTVKAALGNNEVGLYPDGNVAFTYKEQTRKSYTVKEATYRVLRKATVKE